MSMMSYIDGRNIILGTLNYLRGSVSDYKVILYLLYAYRKGFLDSYTTKDHPDTYLNRVVKKIASSGQEYDNLLFQAFRPAIMELHSSEGQFQKAVQQFSRLDDEWYQEYTTRLFDELLSAITSNEGKESGAYTQPYELTKFVAAISGYDGKGALYNPYAGSGSYCTELVGEGRYVAQEKMVSAWGVGVLRLLAHNMNPSTFYCEDSIRLWRGTSSFAENAEAFDCIIATPPFGMKVYHGEYGWVYGDMNSADDLYIRECVPSLTPTGVAIGVFMQGIAFRSGKTQELRKHYVDTDRLDTVIALPAGVFQYTAVPTIVLKFSNKKENPGVVRMVNGSTFTEKVKGRTHVQFDELLTAINEVDDRFVKIVTNEEIKAKDYNILPSRFFVQEVVIPEGFERKTLSDIVEVINGERCSAEEKTGKVVTIANLSDNPFDYQLNIDALPKDSISSNFKRITAPVLLVSKIRTLKPTFASASPESPIYINPNILAFRIREPEREYIPCLILALSKIKDIQTSAVIPSMNLATIRALEVIMPKDYTVQEAFFHNAERERKEAQVRELGLEELMATQKMEFVSIIQRRQHDLNNMLRKVRNACDVISMSLNEKGHDKELIDEDADITVAQAFNSVQGYFDSMSQVINHLADEEIYAEPEIIDLIPRLKAIAEQKHMNYTVRYSEDGYALCDVVQDDDVYHAYVKFGSVNLDRVFFNIIQNAEKHGFTDPSRKDYIIDIEISHDYESSCFVIRFKNNGKPMPEGVDTRRYGRRAEPAGVTGGNGDGGAIVKSTVEHYGGSIYIINDPEAWFPVCVELKIPHYDE